MKSPVALLLDPCRGSVSRAILGGAGAAVYRGTAGGGALMAPAAFAMAPPRRLEARIRLAERRQADLRLA